MYFYFLEIFVSLCDFIFEVSISEMKGVFHSDLCRQSSRVRRPCLCLCFVFLSGRVSDCVLCMCYRLRESVYVCVQVMRSVHVLCVSVCVVFESVYVCVQVMRSVYVLCVSQCISQHSATPDCGVLSVII